MKNAKEQWVLGTMSGTSLDGVDAAMVLTDGERILDFGESGYRAYSPDEQAVLRASLGKWPMEEGTAIAAELVENAHLELLRSIGGGGSDRVSRADLGA